MNGLAPGFAGNGGTGGAAGAAPAGMGLPFALPEHSELDQVNSNLALLPFAVAVSPNSFNMQLKYRLVGPTVPGFIVVSMTSNVAGKR